MNRPRISILLPTYNCAGSVRDTLESIRWADEILVVDSYSTDHTLEICKEYGARIIQHEYINSAKQKNWALPQCSYEWVLQLDTDEVLEAGLCAEIIAASTKAASNVGAFRMPRKNHVLGHWMQFGGVYPDFQTRLIRRDRCMWIDREVHAHVAVDGEIATLTGHILHYGTPNLSKQIHNLDRYTRYEADELHKRGRKFRAYQLLLRPWIVFFYRYLLQRGFRDGWRGFITCVYLGMYDFLSYAKLWEIDELKLERSPQ